MSKNKDFSAIAQTWDEKPQRIHLAAAVARAIKDNIKLSNNMEALDFGSGTGLVTFHLHQTLKHVTAMDSAAGMLTVVEEKARVAGAQNVTILHSDAAVPVLDSEVYDFIFSSMVLHHVDDLASTLEALASAVKSGGVLAVADLAVEDGSFHNDSKGVAHHGIDPEWLIGQLQSSGFHRGQSVVAHQIIKQRGDNQNCYPVFLVWAYKK